MDELEMCWDIEKWHLPRYGIGSKELRVKGESGFLTRSKRWVGSLRPLNVACKMETILE